MIRKLVSAAAVLSAAAGLYIAAGPAASAQTPPPYCADKSNVAILGASSETGYATTGYPSGAQTWSPTTYGWTTRFADSVKAQWQTATANYSHNGAMVSDYLPGGRWSSTTGAVADLGAKKPSIVLINLGGNEWWSLADPTVFQKNLNTLVDNVRAGSPNAVIVLGIYAQLKWQQSSDSGNQPMKYTWDQYASVIYNTAVAKGTALVDFRQYVPPATSTNLPNPSPWSTDGIHQNDAGNLAEYGMWWGWTSSLWSMCG